MKTRFAPCPPELVRIFDDALSGTPVVRRKMFGCPTAFVNGYMIAGLFGDKLFLRLPEVERRRLLKVTGASQFEPIPGRTMREYVAPPRALLRDRKTLSAWIGKAFEYGSSLPPKILEKSGKPKRQAAKTGASKPMAASRKRVKKRATRSPGSETTGAPRPSRKAERTARNPPRRAFRRG